MPVKKSLFFRAISCKDIFPKNRYREVDFIFIFACNLYCTLLFHIHISTLVCSISSLVYLSTLLWFDPLRGISYSGAAHMLNWSHGEKRIFLILEDSKCRFSSGKADRAGGKTVWSAKNGKQTRRGSRKSYERWVKN